MDGQNPELADLAQIYQSLTGESYRMSERYEELQSALLAGEMGIMVEIPWFEQQADHTRYRHQLIVDHVDQGRIYFSNPDKRGDEKIGMTLGGDAQGPEREVHAAGLQSMALDEFQRRFELGGGQALLKMEQVDKAVHSD